jgi:hypothetical protein
MKKLPGRKDFWKLKRKEFVLTYTEKAFVMYLIIQEIYMRVFLAKMEG